MRNKIGMKKTRGIILSMTLLVAMTVFTGKEAKAGTILGDYLAEKDINIGVSVAADYYSKYIWRGFRLDGDQVIQPSVTFSAAGFEGGFWGSFDAESNDTLASDEVDAWIGYSFDLGFLDESLSIVGINAGHTWYSFPEGDTGLAEGSQSREFYVGLTLDTFLSPYFTWYGDYGDESSGGADGDYYMFGIGHSLTLSEEYGISLDLGFEVGLNEKAFIAGSGGYTLSTIGLTVPLTDGLTMAPVLAFSSPFSDLADAADGNQDDEFYGGVSLAYSF